MHVTYGKGFRPEVPAFFASLAEGEKHQKIDALERAIKTELEPMEFETVHYHSHNVYGRELHIPAGTVLTGKIHKFSNFNILSKGEMTVTTDDGMVRVKAPFAIVSPPGTRRAAYAHTDCVWTTIHGTDLSDLAEIEEQFVCKSHMDYLQFVEETKRIESCPG